MGFRGVVRSPSTATLCVLTLFIICVNIKAYVLTQNVWRSGNFGVPLQRVININPQDPDGQFLNYDNMVQSGNDE